MLQFTCGSARPFDHSQFDGVVIGYHWQLFSKAGERHPLGFENQIIRSQFLYGHKHHAPSRFSGCETITEWVAQKVRNFPQVNEWVLINEFTDDLGTPYPDYSLDDLKRYCEAAHLANPNARLIIGDFKPYLLRKWGAIAKITEELKAEGFPAEVGIQTHIKTYNAPVILNRLPRIISMSSVPVHFIEASLWYHNEIDRLSCDFIWEKLEEIADQYQIKSFCNWWVNPIDADIGRRMPTFEDLNLFVLPFNLTRYKD